MTSCGSLNSRFTGNSGIPGGLFWTKSTIAFLYYVCITRFDHT